MSSIPGLGALSGAVRPQPLPRIEPAPLPLDGLSNHADEAPRVDTHAAPRPLGAVAPRDDRDALRHMAHQLEGVFLSQLFQAMRATVKHEGPADASTGEEMFTSMMDDALAAQAAEHMQRGLGEALYRQLARRLPEEGASPVR